MLAKLLSLIAQAKGATIAAVVVAGAATATVGATTPEVQDAVQQVVANLGGVVSQQTHGLGCENQGGQPFVVAQRNAADKLLRDAYQDHQKQLQGMRKDAPKDADNKAVNDVLKKADDELRGTLNLALNQTAALTLGREGPVAKLASASPTSTSSASPSVSPPASSSPSLTASATPKPSCSPKPSTSPSASPTGSASPAASGSGKPEERGRVAVANRTTLDPQIASIVDEAIKKMDDIVKNAKTELGTVPTSEHGKPSDNPGNKPEQQGKPEDKGKPSENPGNRPSPKPTR